MRPYRDYIGWLADQDRAGALQRWSEYLAAVSAPLMLAETTVTAGTAVPVKTQTLLSDSDTARLSAWAAQTGLTLSTAVTFAWAVLLGRLTDRDDVVFGTVVSGRPERLTGVETMVGLFINTLPLRLLLAPGQSFAALLAQTQARQAWLQAHCEDVGICSSVEKVSQAQVRASEKASS